MSGGGSFKRMQASVQQAGSERTELDLVHGLGCHLRKRQVIPVVTKRLLHLRSCVLDAKRGIPGRGGVGGGVGGGGVQSGGTSDTTNSGETQRRLHSDVLVSITCSGHDTHAMAVDSGIVHHRKYGSCRQQEQRAGLYESACNPQFFRADLAPWLLPFPQTQSYQIPG